MGYGRAWLGRFAALPRAKRLRVGLATQGDMPLRGMLCRLPLCVVCWLALVGFGSGLRAAAQSGTDGAIGGQVVSAAGSPVAGALVVVRDLETGLAMRALSGTKGEFLLVRLPVGEYTLSVQEMGVEFVGPAQCSGECGN
jgi:hypothetical protein